MFSQVFLQDILFSIDIANSYTSCGDKALYLTSSEEVVGMEVVSSPNMQLEAMLAYSGTPLVE